MIYALSGLVISLILLIVSLFSKSKSIFSGGREPQSLTPLQREVGREYINLKLPRHKIPFNEFCFPHKFKLQKPQKFVAEYMAPGSDCMNLLAYWGIGSGKSLGIIECCEKWTSRGKPLVILPASLVSNFLNEMRSPLLGYKYISKEETEEIKVLKPSNFLYKEIIKRSNEKIYRKYDIMSYNKFMKKGAKLLPSFIAIDEIHNCLNQSGTIYKSISKFVRDRPNTKLLCLSATPIYDNKSELLTLLKLMRVDIEPGLLDNPEQLRKALDGKISYFRGSPAHVYPDVTINYDVCRMSKFQSRWFRSEVEAEMKRSGNINLKEVSNNFYSKSRAKSNIVFPRGLAPSQGGLAKLTKSLILENLSTYSIKFARIIKRLKKKRLSFIYSSFAGLGGIQSLLRCLHAFGFRDYKSTASGPKYAIWSGNETASEKNAIQTIFNSPDNIDGKLIQVIIASPAGKEGVSFYNVRDIHLVDPYWNYSRIAQVIGRGVRTCSHKNLPKAERNVTVYIYVAVTHDSSITKNNFINKREIKTNESIDGYILKIAENKRDENNELLDLLTEIAVDKKLFQIKQA